MTILFLSARYPPDIVGGGEISTQLVAEALAAEGHTVTVLCGASQDADGVLSRVRVRRLRTLGSWWAKPLNERIVSERTARVVEEFLTANNQPPDILHAQEFRSALSVSLISHPARVVTIRDYAPICGTTNNMWWDGSSCDGCFWTNVLFRCHRVVEAPIPRKPFRVWQYKGNLGFRLRAFRRIPYHVYTSTCLRDRVFARLAPPYTTWSVVIPNPVDTSWLEQPPVPLPTAPVLYGFGRLEHTKGTDVLLESCTQLVRTLPTLQLHLGGGEVDRYQALAARFGIVDHVTFHDMITHERVRELIDQAAIVVSPHRWEEPFGRAALEAGARGRALVASNLGGVRETTTEKTAVLIPPGDPSALAATIGALLGDRQRLWRMGQAARQRVEQEYRATFVAQQLVAVYERILRNHPRETGRAGDERAAEALR